MFPLVNRSKEVFQQPIIHRESYYKKLDEFSQSKEIIVLQGQRRVGKSYLMVGYLQSKGIDPNTVFFINKELDREDAVMDVKDLNTIFDAYCKEFGDPTYILIDEIQDIVEREKFVRAMYALKKYHIIISGSNAQLLSGELATFLSGRYLSLEVFPLGYDEYLLFTGKANIYDSYMEYQRNGGLSEQVLLSSSHSKKSYLENVLNTIFIKDIVTRYSIKDVGYLRKVIEFVSDIIGKEISLRNMHNSSKTFGRGEEASLVKLSNYIMMLQTSYLIHKASRYDIVGKKILEHNEKYYFNDIGIRNSIKNVEATDKGKVLENIVYLHLKRCGYIVYVGNFNGKEIDFVAQRHDTTIFVQVARMIDTQETREREYGNLLSLKNAYPKYVVTTDMGEHSNTSGIQHFTIMEFIGHIG